MKYPTVKQLAGVRQDRLRPLLLVGGSLFLTGLAHAQVETIGGGTIASPAVAPSPAYGIGGMGFVPVKNWNFGTNGTIKTYTDLSANFYYHDNFGQFHNPNVSSSTVSPDAANALTNQPIEGVNTTGPVREFFTDSMKTYYKPLNGATTITSTPIVCGTGSIMPKWTLPNGGALLGQDVIWETRVRYVPLPYFYFALWTCGYPWNASNPAGGVPGGAEMDLIETFGVNNGSTNNYDGASWHTDVVGHTESTNYLTGSWRQHMAEYGITTYDPTQYHTWTWLYRKDNTFTAYVDGIQVQDGYVNWTVGGVAGGTPSNMSFLIDGCWGSNTIPGMKGGSVAASDLVGKYYEYDYSRVYLRSSSGGDIGAVALTGSDSANTSGIYTLTASGADVGGTADAFHYAPRLVTGDCTITARVDSLTHTDDWAKAGVMMRDTSMDANAPGATNAFMFIPALAQAGFQYRTAAGATTGIIDLGDSWALNDGFTDGARTNGTDAADAAWYTMGTPTVSIVDDTAGIGSGNALQLTPTSTGRGIIAGFPARTLADGDSITLTVNWRFAGTVGLNQANSLRYGIHSSNGTPTTADGTTQSDISKGYFVMTNPGAAGSNTSLKRETGGSPGVLGGTDWSGLGTAGASVSAGTTKHSSAITITRSGSTLVVSTSIDNLAAATGTDSAPVTYTFDQFAISLTGATLPSPIIIDDVRVGDGMAADISPPNWVKLNRTGNVFTGYYSPDGIIWTQVGSQTIAMGPTISVGLAATSHNNSALATANFSNVKLDPQLVSQTIGSLVVPGSDSLSSGTYTISGAGLGNSGISDGCRYLSQTLIGDGTITARVNSFTVFPDYGSVASVMIRDDMTGTKWGAVSASFGIPKLATAKLATRTALDTAVTYTVGATIHPPCWMRLTRVGNVFTGAYSADGVAWTTVGSQTVTMGQQVKVGLAVSANSTAAAATAVIDNVTITGTRGL